MNKKLPFIISAAAVLTITASLGLVFRNKIRPQTVKAQEYQIEFTADDVDETLSGEVDTNTVWIYLEKETPKGNKFSLYDFGTIYGGSITYKQNGNIFKVSDGSGNGYYTLQFKFNLEMATFDHITFLGSFTAGYGDDVTTETYITYNQIDDNGYVVCDLYGIHTATVSQINVVYYC